MFWTLCCTHRRAICTAKRTFSTGERVSRKLRILTDMLLLQLHALVFDDYCLLAIMFLRFCQNKTYMYIYSIFILNDSLLYHRVWGAACTRLSKFILIHQYLFLCMFLDCFFFSHRKGNYQQMWQQKRTSLRSITCMQQWRLVYKTGSCKCWL